MIENFPDNLTIFDVTGPEEVSAAFRDSGVWRAHFTNGTYTARQGTVLPTTLAGFQYVRDEVAMPGDAFVVAVNSDAGMHRLLAARGATRAQHKALEPMYKRAAKVAVPLALQFPERAVFAVFFDEPTPTPLYDVLADDGMAMASLHKWGYGAQEGAPRIEGAHNFEHVFAYPLPNPILPNCYRETPAEGQTGYVQPVSLADYITPNGRLLFALAPELQKFAAPVKAPRQKGDRKVPRFYNF